MANPISTFVTLTSNIKDSSESHPEYFDRYSTPETLTSFHPDILTDIHPDTLTGIHPETFDRVSTPDTLTGIHPETFDRVSTPEQSQLQSNMADNYIVNRHLTDPMERVTSFLMEDLGRGDTLHKKFPANGLPLTRQSGGLRTPPQLPTLDLSRVLPSPAKPSRFLMKTQKTLKEQPETLTQARYRKISPKENNLEDQTTPKPTKPTQTLTQARNVYETPLEAAKRSFASYAGRYDRFLPAGHYLSASGEYVKYTQPRKARSTTHSSRDLADGPSPMSETPKKVLIRPAGCVFACSTHHGHRACECPVSKYMWVAPGADKFGGIRMYPTTSVEEVVPTLPVEVKQVPEETQVNAYPIGPRRVNTLAAVEEIVPTPPVKVELIPEETQVSAHLNRLECAYFPVNVKEAVPTSAAEVVVPEEFELELVRGVGFVICRDTEVATPLVSTNPTGHECASTPVDVRVKDAALVEMMTTSLQEHELLSTVNDADVIDEDDDWYDAVDGIADADADKAVVDKVEGLLFEAELTGLQADADEAVADPEDAEADAEVEQIMTTTPQEHELLTAVDDADVTDTEEDEVDVFYPFEETEYSACYDQMFERYRSPDEVDRRFVDELYGGAEAYRTAYLQADNSELESDRIAAAEVAEAEAIALGKAALEADALKEYADRIAAEDAAIREAERIRIASTKAAACEAEEAFRAAVAREVNSLVQDLKARAAEEIEAVKAAAVKAAAEIEALSQAANDDIYEAKVKAAEAFHYKAGDVVAYVGDALVDADDKIACAIGEISASTARDFEAALSEATKEAAETLQVATREALHQETEAFRSDLSTRLEEELERMRCVYEEAKFDGTEAVRDTAALAIEAWIVKQATDKAAFAGAEAALHVAEADELLADADRLRESFMLKFGFDTESNMLEFLNQRTSVTCDDDLDIGYYDALDEIEAKATGSVSVAEKASIEADVVPAVEDNECRVDVQGSLEVLTYLSETALELAEDVKDYEGVDSPVLDYLCRLQVVLTKLHQITAAQNAPQDSPAEASRREVNRAFAVEVNRVVHLAYKFYEAMSQLGTGRDLENLLAAGSTGLSDSAAPHAGIAEFESKVTDLEDSQRDYEASVSAPSEYRVSFSPGSRTVSYRGSAPADFAVQTWEDTFWSQGRERTPTVVLDIDAYDIDDFMYSDENGDDFCFPESTDVCDSEDGATGLADASTDPDTPVCMADTNETLGAGTGQPADDSIELDTADAYVLNNEDSLAEEVPPLRVQDTGSRITEYRAGFVEIFYYIFLRTSFQKSLEKSLGFSPRAVSVLKPCRETDLESANSLNLKDNTMPFKQDKSAFNQTLLHRDMTDIADLLLTPEFEAIAKWGARRCFAPKALATIKMKNKAIMTSIPRNIPSFWAYLGFLTKLIPKIDPATVALYRQFIRDWSVVEETDCHTHATCYQYNLYLLLTMDKRFNLRTLKDWMTGTRTLLECHGCYGCEPGREELEEVPMDTQETPRDTTDDQEVFMDVEEAQKDTADSYITRSQARTKICMRCGQYYHSYGHITVNECPNTFCEWFQGIDNFPGMPSTKVFTEQTIQDDFLRKLFTLASIDVNFGLINLFRGELTGASELICRAGISKLLWRLKDNKPLYEADEERVKWCARRFYGSANYDVLFPSALTNTYFHWDRDTMDSMRDTMDSDANKPDALALTTPSKMGDATTAQPGSAVTGGHAAVDVTSNLQAGAGAEIVQPNTAVATGAGAGETILTTFGGIPTELLQMGGYVNSILAFIYNPVPLATIAVNSTTLEYATLYSWKVNPWDLASVGPYIHKWAMLHQRFSGGFNVGLQVSTTSVIIGKIGLYYIPAGVKIPAKMTRTNMKIFDHTVIDLYTPSSNQLEIRMTSQNDFYATQATAATKDYGQVLIMAYTAITNVMGGDTAPPVYPTICLTEDSIYSVPLFDSSDLPPSSIMAPTLPYDTFCVTEGHNVAPHYFENSQKAERAKGDMSDNMISVQWMTTSGRIRTQHSDLRGENEMSFYWGDRFAKTNPDYSEAQREIGERHDNPHRYMYNFIEGPDGKPKFDGLSSIANTAVIGKTYNQQDPNNGLAGTDQFAQKFSTEEFIHTISYITAGFRVWEDPHRVPYWGGFTNDGAETVSQVPVQIKQFGEAPSSLKVRMVTGEDLGTESRKKFFEIRASGLGLHSVANVPSPNSETYSSIQNPAPFEIGPEIYSMMNQGQGVRACPSISLTESVVCNEAPETTGQDVPPGFKLLTFWEPEDQDNWFGLPAVLPGVRGVTTATSKSGEDFMIQVRAYLKATGSKSYVMACVSTDSSMEFDVLCNEKGAFVYSVDWDYAVIPTKTNYFYTRFLSADSDNEWVGINPPTDKLFQSRLSVSRSHGGFSLDGGDKNRRVPHRPLDRDTMDSAAATIFGGMLGGIGQAIGSIGDRHFKEEMQRNKFAQETSLQKRSIAGQMVMNTRNNESRDYATRKQAETQENVSARQAKTQVELANTRVIAGNRVSDFSG